jgi:predicted ArsR family transcriptional regulator
LRFNGRATGNEIANSIGKAPKHIWPRLTELAAMGRIRDTGYRVNGGRGRPQVIWALATTSPANDPLAIENESPVMRLI